MGQSRAKWGRSVDPEDSGMNPGSAITAKVLPLSGDTGLVPVPPCSGCMSCHRGYASLIPHFPQLLLGP